MASLQDSIRTGQGQLAKTSQEELQSQASMAGRSSTPISPLEAGSIGANPDSAKMAGTPENKANSLRQALQENRDFSTQQRQEQPGGQETEEQKKKREEVQAAVGFTGNLSDRVAALKQQQMASLAPAGTIAVNQQAIDSDRPADITDADWQAAQAALAKVAAGTSDTDDIALLSRALRKPELKAEDLNKYISGEQQNVADAIANATSDTVLASQLLEPAELETIASLLGIPVEELAEYGVADLQDAVNQEQQANQNQAANLRALVSDPNASPAERSQARQLLKEMGAIGTRATEEGFATLQEKIENGDEVSFAGRKMGIEEALSDDTIKGTIKRFFDEPGFAEELAKTEPELAAAIKANQEEFQQMAAAIPEQFAEFASVQQKNKSIAQLPNGLTLDDSVMKNLIPGWGEGTATEYQTPPAIAVMKNPNIPQRERDEVQKTLTAVSGISPALAQQYAQLDYAELKKAGLTTPAGALRLVDNITSFNEVENIAPEANPELFMTTLFGENVDTITQKLGDMNALNALGMGTPETKAFLALVDANNDGKVDSPVDIHQRAMKMLTGGTGQLGNLNDIIARGIPSPKDLASQAVSARATDAAFFNTVKSAFADGKVTPAEMTGLAGKSGENMSYEDLVKLEKQVGKNTTLTNIINAKTNADYKSAAEGLPGYDNSAIQSVLTGKQGVLNNPRDAEAAMVQLKALAAQNKNNPALQAKFQKDLTALDSAVKASQVANQAFENAYKLGSSFRIQGMGLPSYMASIGYGDKYSGIQGQVDIMKKIWAENPDVARALKFPDVYNPNKGNLFGKLGNALGGAIK